MASHDEVGIGDFVLLNEITVQSVVENLKTRCVCAPSEPPPAVVAGDGSGGLGSEVREIADAVTGRRRRGALRSAAVIPRGHLDAAPARGRVLRISRWSHDTLNIGGERLTDLRQLRSSALSLSL